jgi:4-hydroxy-tetrahydrodipicolinate synthase
MQWKGVMPAMTTCFDPHMQVDHAFMAKHANWMIDSGCTGLILLGSLGEAATLSTEEKIAILRNMVQSAGSRVPVIAAISSLSTSESVHLAKAAENAGCSGLMILPPYVYQGDWREMKTYLGHVIRATSLSCMLYNNPVSYGTDFLPAYIAELAAEHPNLHAVKESSTDVRRITAIRTLTSKLAIFVGVDDAIVEGIAAGATGWVAGLVNAFPAESVHLFQLASAAQDAAAFELYRWFLPLLRMDTVPKFIQLIKLVQQEVNMGSARVRGPRLELTGAELEEARTIIHSALNARPALKG